MKSRWPFLMLVSFLIVACVKPYIPACREIAESPKGDFKYTREQAATACDRSQFYADPHLVIPNKEKNTWELNSNGILSGDLEKVIADQLKSLDTLLSYKDREDADWVDWFTGFRKGLEKEEAIALYVWRRLVYVHTYNEFTDLVGELPQSMQPKGVSYFFPFGRKFYSLRILYPPRRLMEVSLTAEYLEVAKSNGTLRHIDTFETVSSQEFAKKVPDIYDPNAFTWEKQNRGWVVKSFKVMPDKDKPADNIVHYIEVYRKTKDFKGVEEKPAVRGFMAAGGSRVTVFVVDYDREGKPGYGSPDEVVRTFTDITTGKDIFADSMLREKLLDSLYDHPQNNIAERPHRRKPKERQIYTEIVKMGEAKIDLWEQGNWSVPFDYKTLSQNLEIEFEKPKSVEEKRLEEKEKLKKVKLYHREFKREGSTVVIEYWLPKKEYAQWNIAYSAALMDTLKIRRKGGQEETGEVGYFGARIKAIDYLFGGRWFRLIDEDGDGVFEKKRSIADPSRTNNNNAGFPSSE